MKIWGLHDGHACGVYRILTPLWALRYLGGHEVDISYGWDERAEEYPIIVGQRVSKAEALESWRRLYARRRLVYETDDDVWSIDDWNYSAKATHTADTIDSTEMAVRVAHLVTVSTEPLAEVLRKFNPNVAVLPNVIDAKLLDVERPRPERLTVGWAGGDSHLRDFVHVVAPLKRFLRKHPQVEFHNIGTDFRKAVGLAGRYTGWQGLVWDYYRSIDFDIGIAPLAPTTFNRSKSAIKAMEYAALGIPVVASDMEPYRDFVKHGETGFLARREHEWYRFLRELANDRDLRERMGAAAREEVRNHTIQEHWTRWEDAYRSLGGDLGENSDVGQYQRHDERDRAAQARVGGRSA